MSESYDYIKELMTQTEIKAVIYQLLPKVRGIYFRETSPKRISIIIVVPKWWWLTFGLKHKAAERKLFKAIVDRSPIGADVAIEVV